jgi:glycosyltransferase involved in cell wall biosynthesis
LRISINGRFLSQAMTGVQRYAAEMVKALDQLLAADEAPPALRGAEWQLLAPPDAEGLPRLQRIDVRKTGRRTGHAWDQIDLLRAATGGPLISLANSGPVLHRRHVVVLHDAQVFRKPEFFHWTYSTAHRALGFLLARNATIATVSEFSRRELAASLWVPQDSIPVFANSAEHFAATAPDFSIIDRLGLTPFRFFLTVGSLKKNKNISLAIEAATRLQRPDVPLVVVGGDNSKVFQGDPTVAREGIVLAGRLNDEEIAALYARATAFVFPSLYEGFGVPPLEAMIFGCPVISSTADALRETCGTAAAYFSPLNAAELQQRMLERLAAGAISDAERARQATRVAAYSWSKSAKQLMRFLAEPAQ